jgi:ferredoxin
VQIDARCCQGHGRCYDLAPALFGDDEEGYGKIVGDGIVAQGQEHDARLAAANCPERAIEITEGGCPGHHECARDSRAEPAVRVRP